MLITEGSNQHTQLSIKPYLPEKCLAFLHVPKCSGGSLAGCLQSALKPRQALYGHDRVLFGGFDRFAFVSHEARSSIFLAASDVPTGADYVYGHFSAATLSAAYPHAQVVMIAREPVCRLLSLWLFWRAASDEQLMTWDCWGDVVKTARGPLADFLRNTSAACNTDNVMIRMLLWPDERIPKNDFISHQFDDELLASALGVLAAFSYLSVIEEPGFHEKLSSWLGSPVIRGEPSATENIPVNLREPLHTHLSLPVFTRLKHLTRLDRRLWCAIARMTAPDLRLDDLCQQSLARTVARHALMMA